MLNDEIEKNKLKKRTKKQQLKKTTTFLIDPSQVNLKLVI
jgi:hypothetical protein